jgi:hypothetical protein
MNTFLPTGYEAPIDEGNYFKFKKGKNHFRVMGSAVVGWEYWTKENKPIRSKTPYESVPADAKLNDGRFDPKFFWAFPVYNYAAKKVQILEVTQKTVREAMEGLVSDEAWGDPAGYDIVINATGDGMDREYSVMPKPHTAKPEAVMPSINLEALFTGADPFTSKVELEPVEEMQFAANEPEIEYPTDEVDPNDVPYGEDA